jgi:cell wall-associated NlpC family hydrolase
LSLQCTTTVECKLVSNAVRYLGEPYVQNGTSPSVGFDDKGFVRYVFRTVGIRLPRDRQRMLDAAPRVPQSRLQPGDLVFFKNTVTAGLSHVGIYLGRGRFIHAEWYRYGVTITRFVNDPRDGNYWDGHFLAGSNPLHRR